MVEKCNELQNAMVAEIKRKCSETIKTQNSKIEKKNKDGAVQQPCNERGKETKAKEEVKSEFHRSCHVTILLPHSDRHLSQRTFSTLSPN